MCNSANKWLKAWGSTGGAVFSVTELYPLGISGSYDRGLSAPAHALGFHQRGKTSETCVTAGFRPTLDWHKISQVTKPDHSVLFCLYKTRDVYWRQIWPWISKNKNGPIPVELDRMCRSTLSLSFKCVTFSTSFMNKIQRFKANTIPGIIAWKKRTPAHFAETCLISLLWQLMYVQKSSVNYQESFSAQDQKWCWTKTFFIGSDMWHQRCFYPVAVKINLVYPRWNSVIHLWHICDDWSACS